MSHTPQPLNQCAFLLIFFIILFTFELLLQYLYYKASSNSCHVTLCQVEDNAGPLVKKEEPESLEPKQEPMETEDKKTDIKGEPKEEEESSTPGTASSSPSQSRRKSECRNVTGKCRPAFLLFVLMSFICYMVYLYSL